MVNKYMLLNEIKRSEGDVEVGAEEIIQEKITGTKADRPELNRLLNILRKGDVVLITDLTRLSSFKKCKHNTFKLYRINF